MERYIVLDYYEDIEGEILGYDLPLDVAIELVNERAADTDGECEIEIISNEFDKERYEILMERIIG